MRFGHDTVDLHELYHVLSTDETERIVRFMPWDRHATIQESYEFVERIERRWNDGSQSKFKL